MLLNVIGGTAVTWKQPEQFQELLRGLSHGVFHIHEHWRDADSVVLGQNSYDRIVKDEKAQQLLRAALAGFSTLFVGFGAGLSDPNFLQLRRWIREILDDSNFPPTVLVSNDELTSASEALHPDGIQVIAYGAEFGDLELFLADLGPVPEEQKPPRVFGWAETRALLERLHFRIRREFEPEVVVTSSGPGSFAAWYSMRLDKDEVPVVSTVTFPKTSGRSEANLKFSELASSADWRLTESEKWDVFVPNVLFHLPKGSSVLLVDDRTVTGTTQDLVKSILKEPGHEVRRAALVVHPRSSADVNWFEHEFDAPFELPWGTDRGRS